MMVSVVAASDESFTHKKALGLRAKSSKLLFLSTLCLALTPSVGRADEAATAQAQPKKGVLSNRMPVELVRTLMGRHLESDGSYTQVEKWWEDEFDDPGSEKNKDLVRFWDSLRDDGPSTKEMVDQLFGNIPLDEKGNPKFDEASLPSLYSVKFNIFRWLREHGPQTYTDFTGKVLTEKRLNAIFESWKRRYIDTMVGMIMQSSRPELREVARNFSEMVRGGRLQLVDLSRQERQRLSQKMPESHGLSLLLQDKHSGSYYVTGLYNAKEAYFAVDFAQPFAKTLITATHEAFHAASPVVAMHRATYNALLPTVMRLFSKWGQIQEQLDTRPLLPVLHEEDFVALGNISRQLREEQIRQLEEQRKQLEKDIANKIARAPEELKPVYEPTPQEKESLQRWIRSIIGLTLENEFRAYVYSMALYVELKDKLGLLPPDKYHTHFLNAMQAGAQSFVERLNKDTGYLHVDEIFTEMDAREKERMEALAKNPDPKAPKPMRPSDVQQQLVEASRSKARIVTHEIYLREVEAFAKSLPATYDDLMKTNAESAKEAVASVLPKWAQRGGFDRLDNPYRLYTAKLTTAIAVGQREYLEQIRDKLREKTDALTVLHAGVLDMHDLNAGGLKLIGARYWDTKSDNLPLNLDDSLKGDLDTLPTNYMQFFPRGPRNADEAPRGDHITGQEVAQNLVQYRLLQGLTLFDGLVDPFSGEGPLRNTVSAAKVAYDSLQTGVNEVTVDPNAPAADKAAAVDEDEDPGQSDARRAALKAELEATLKNSILLHKDISEMNDVVEDVAALYDMSRLAADRAQNWQKVEGSYAQSSLRVQRVLEGMGLAARLDPNAGKKRIEEVHKALREQLRPLKNECAKAPKNGRASFHFGTPVKVNDRLTIKVNVACYEGKLYLVRPPGDYDKMTTLPNGDAIESRILNEGRPVQLMPTRIFDDEPEKKKWFFFF